MSFAYAVMVSQHAKSRGWSVSLTYCIALHVALSIQLICWNPQWWCFSVHLWETVLVFPVSVVLTSIWPVYIFRELPLSPVWISFSCTTEKTFFGKKSGSQIQIYYMISSRRTTESTQRHQHLLQVHQQQSAAQQFLIKSSPAFVSLISFISQKISQVWWPYKSHCVGSKWPPPALRMNVVLSAITRLGNPGASPEFRRASQAASRNRFSSGRSLSLSPGGTLWGGLPSD